MSSSEPSGSEQTAGIDGAADREDPLEYAPAYAMPVFRELRIWAALALCGSAAVLGFAIWLKPDPRGLGTHEQMGLAPCGMMVVSGLPCPTCGMTTAFAHTVRGQWIRAFWSQPTGFVLALATVVLLVGSIYTLMTGRLPPVRSPALTPFRLLLGLLILLVGGWGFKLAVGLATGTLPAFPQ